MKLSSAHEFRHKCFEIYKKNNEVLIYKKAVHSEISTQSSVIENEEYYLIKNVNEGELEFADQLEIEDTIEESVENVFEDSYSSHPEESLPSSTTRKRKQILGEKSPIEKKPKLNIPSTSTPISTTINIKNETNISIIAKKETADNAAKNKRNSYTVGTKLAVIELAEKQGNRVASRVYQMNESCVRGWRKQKGQLLLMNVNKKTQRRASPHWPHLEVELKQWVSEQYQNDTKVRFQDIKTRSIAIAQQQNIENFKGTNSFIFKFMKRNDVPSASPKIRKCKVETTTSDTLDPLSIQVLT